MGKRLNKKNNDSLDLTQKKTYFKALMWKTNLVPVFYFFLAVLMRGLI